jgi:hypothetical protein
MNKMTTIAALIAAATFSIGAVAQNTGGGVWVLA